MKKLLISLTALMLVLFVCISVMAENSSPATQLYDSLVQTLFHTDNITLTGTAKFSLDGVWFKTAKITLKQDGNRTFRELSLRGPKRDGTVQKNGYTIVTDGTALYLMEAVTPGVYRTGGTAEHTSLLRNSLETEQLIGLGRALVGQADLFLGADAVTETREGDIRFELKDNVPDLFNAMVNNIFQFAGRRYFDEDFDCYSMENSARIDDYETVTRGILYTARTVSLKEASVTLKRYGNGVAQYLEGDIALNVENDGEGMRQVDVSFQVNVKDVDKTTVKRFAPDDYGVVSEYEMAAAEPRFFDDSDLNGPELQALNTLTSAGFDKNTIVYMAYYNKAEEGYEVSFGGAEGWEETFLISADEKLTEMIPASSEWQNGSEDQFTYNPEPDKERDEQALEFVNSFIQGVDPDLSKSLKDLKTDWLYKRYDHVYAQYTGKTQDENSSVVTVVVRISPYLRIESFSCRPDTTIQ